MKQVPRLTPDQQQELNAYYQQERSEMLKFIPGGVCKILDVGCADGNFGNLLKRQKVAEVWGVELNQAAASLAAQKLDKVICSKYDDQLDLPQNYFDCIVFNDVLEHFVDPFAALIDSKKFLSEQGFIIASIPNVRYFGNVWKLLVEKDWKYTDHGILDRTHLRFFTQRSIVETFVSLGYHIDLIEGINPIDQKHPHHLSKFNLLNYMLLKHIEDMRYFQFAIVAHPVLTRPPNKI